MHQCDHCDYKSARIWCINRHIKTKHGEIQKGSGVTKQLIPRTSTQAQNVPIHPDTNKIIRQWQEAYKNMETRNKDLLNGWQNHNKQWQAAYRQLQAWREEDGVYANEEIQQLSYLNSDPRR